MTNFLNAFIKLFLPASVLSIVYLNFNSPKTYLYSTGYSVPSTNIRLLSNSNNNDTYFETISLILVKKADLLDWIILSTHFKLTKDYSSVYEIQSLILLLTLN